MTAPYPVSYEDWQSRRAKAKDLVKWSLKRLCEEQQLDGEVKVEYHPNDAVGFGFHFNISGLLDGHLTLSVDARLWEDELWAAGWALRDAYEAYEQGKKKEDASV